MKKEKITNEERSLILEALKLKMDNIIKERDFRPKESPEHYRFFIIKYNDLISKLEKLPKIILNN